MQRYGNDGMIVTEYISAAQQLLNQLRTRKPILKAEEQMIESLLFMIRMELDARKARQQNADLVEPQK